MFTAITNISLHVLIFYGIIMKHATIYWFHCLIFDVFAKVQTMSHILTSLFLQCVFSSDKIQKCIQLISGFPEP